MEKDRRAENNRTNETRENEDEPPKNNSFENDTKIPAKSTSIENPVIEGNANPKLMIQWPATFLRKISMKKIV